MGWRSSTATPQTIISAWSTRLSKLTTNCSCTSDNNTDIGIIQHLLNDRKDRPAKNYRNKTPDSVILLCAVFFFFFLALQEVISASVLALRETDAPAEIVVWLLILPLSRQWARNRKWCISIKDLPSYTVRLSSHRGASWWCTPPILHSYWMSL